MRAINYVNHNQTDWMFKLIIFFSDHKGKHSCRYQANCKICFLSIEHQSAPQYSKGITPQEASKLIDINVSNFTVLISHRDNTFLLIIIKYNFQLFITYNLINQLMLLYIQRRCSARQKITIMMSC